MILLLAGTTEARNLAGYMAEAGVKTVASLAGVTRAPLPMAVETRVGGFGGDAGFEAYLDRAGITAVIDATHPFAAKITARTARICAARGLPYLRYERPGWRSRPGDAWHEVADYAGLSAIIPVGARVFLATGRQSLSQMAHLADRHLICRVIDPPEGAFPYPNGAFVIGRPPFSEDTEIEALRALNPNWMVVKNAGGASGRAKLDAARRLGISVAMIARPAVPAGIERREQVLDALEWAEAHGRT
ncbi:cobalt-precorrin-6A reductase [Celeribacter baekdonensis]|uniref:Cobalt-precorrin-6A reductase n=1 Tax=Celeribacter baekdonensis TaxID=875171 RepID=A0A2R4M195_9RHOB|nr:cobalt-precorrin-6A reductase [Celeribacter baekdonensis]AVW90943.1 cobalt-precorrin-6A reductase [Celeribacter baekdonensis]